MGYYTSYTLNVNGVKNMDEFKKLHGALEQLGLIGNVFDSYNDFSHMFNEEKHQAYFSPCDMAKWYDHDIDMADVSSEFPDMTFELFGDGEESDDYWVAYYKDGDDEHCVGSIVYEKPVRIMWDERGS